MLLEQAKVKLIVGQVPAPAPEQEAPIQEPAQLDRQQAVRAALQKLRQLIVELSNSIYQMQLTEEQVSELADKMVYQLADSMNDITIERVKEIANDLLLGVDEPRKRKQRT
jgi:hypothetical protein